MVKWKEYKIADICSVICGAGFKKSEFVDEGIPVIKTANIKSNKIILCGLSHVSDLVAEKNKKSRILYGDILFTMTGNKIDGNPNNRIGRIAIFKEKEPFMLNQRLCIIRPKVDFVDRDYLAYYLLSIEAQQYFTLREQISGSSVNISLSAIKEFAVKLPDMETQKRIVANLKKIDEKIEQCIRENDTLEQEAKECFENIFLKNPDPSWREGVLADLGTIVAGGTPSKSKPEYYSEEGIAWITPRDLSYNKSKFIYRGKTDISELGLKNSSASKLPAGTVLFSSRAPIGYIAIAAKEMATNQGFRSVIPHEEIGSAYIYYLLKSLLPTIKNLAVGAMFKEIAGSAMKKIPLTIPDPDALEKFNTFCNPVFAKQKSMEQKKYDLEKLREEMIFQVFSGANVLN